MDERELSLAVVGLDYPNPDRSKSNRRFEAALCRPGDPVELRPEPTNRHDPRAVAVFSARGVQLGYLTAERCGWIGAKLRAGEEVAAVFQETGTAATVIRVRFGGGAPSLPKKRRGRRPTEDFYADPEGPEWGA